MWYMPTVHPRPSSADCLPQLIYNQLLRRFMFQNLEETYYERLVGLTEMFPEPVRNAACKTASLTKSGW